MRTRTRYRTQVVREVSYYWRVERSAQPVVWTQEIEFLTGINQYIMRV